MRRGRESTRAPRLFVVAGPMASGKSTVARRLAGALDAELFEADALRARARQRGEPGADWPGFSARVYERLFERARRALASGHTVVLDGTFRTRALRRRARELAQACGAPFRLVEARADPATVRRRLAERPDPDGWLALFEGFRRLWEPIRELPPREHLAVDTNGPPDELDEAIRRIVATI